MLAACGFIHESTLHLNNMKQPLREGYIFKVSTELVEEMRFHYDSAFFERLISFLLRFHIHCTV